MNGECNIGIDIGGTKVNIGIVSENGRIIDHTKIKTIKTEMIEVFVSRILEALDELLKKNQKKKCDISFVGIGVPGTVNTKEGIVEYCPNLEWEDIQLKKYFQPYFPGVRIEIIQDSWAAAVAEHEYGAGKDCANIACVTIGTGIGCGVIINDKIFMGGMHSAGEIGHSIVQMDGLQCNCGRKGCLERYSSGTGIFESAYEKFPEMFEGRGKKAETVFELAKEQYQPAIDLIDHSVRMLAMGLANLVTVLSVEKILISGGICQHRELVVEPLQKYIYEYGYYAWVRQNRLKVESAKVKENAPMLGAAVLYKAMD